MTIYNERYLIYIVIINGLSLYKYIKNTLNKFVVVGEGMNKNKGSKTLVLSMIKTILAVFIIFICSNLLNNNNKEINTNQKWKKFMIHRI